jgi:hypothetical protein
VAARPAGEGCHEDEATHTRVSHRCSFRVDSGALFSQATGRLWADFAHNSSCAAEGKTMSGSVTAKRLNQVRGVLSDRDWQIISTLARVRVASGAQLELLHFNDVTRRRAQQRLAVLVRNRVLARLPRVIGGVRSGSAGHVYTLDVGGQRLADLESGRRPGRPRGVGTAFLAHALTVTDVHVGLIMAERSGQLRVVRFVGEPGSWRSFHGAGGARTMLKPDAHVVLDMGGFEDHWFIEVDMSTEVPSTLTRKCDVYRAYWQSGREQARRDVFPRVLWLVPDRQRAAVMTKVISRQPANVRSLFAVSLHADAVTRMRQGAGS